MSSVHFDHVMARQAAERLDGLADQLERTMRDSAPALAVVPAGIDAVSERAVHTFNGVSVSYQNAYGQGVHELRKLAANLRAHARTFGKADQSGAEPFSALL